VLGGEGLGVRGQPLFDRRQSEREDGVPSWPRHSRRLGPFKRPRPAMVALEQEATFLKNRHGDSVLFGDQLWAEG
jgi:hypothetical protein